MEGPTPVSPRRTKEELGIGGEPWRLGLNALAEAKKKAKDSIKDLEESEGGVCTTGLVT
jgi:hypothetical protein